MKDHTKLYGTLAAIALATLAIVGFSMSGAAVVATENVTIDDPANDTVEVDVSYDSGLASPINATVELQNSSGAVVDSQTIEGAAGATETFTVSASEAGDYEINVTSEDETSTTLAATRLVAERAVTVEDAANETVYVDLAFQGESDATADVVLNDDTGTAVYNETITYDATTESTTASLSINETDGLVNGNFTAVATVDPASGYSAAYAGLEDPDDAALFGGEILGQDTGVAIAGLLVLGGGWYYAREEELI